MSRDKFNLRLMIPIRDRDGKVYGFTGRVFPFDKSERPKYLNSPESQWFKKSEIWYGLDLSREEIKIKREVIVVEGNMDVISLHRFGLTNCVASQGTAVGQSQIKQLKYLADTVLLAFDNDNAGYVSGNKFFVLAYNTGLEVQKVVIPKEFKDIDEYLSSMYNPGDPIQLQTKSYLDYLIDYHHFGLISDNPLTQKESVSAICEILAGIDSVTAELYLKKISDLVGIRLAALQGTLDSYKNRQTRYSSNQDSKLTDNNIDIEENSSVSPKEVSALSTAIATFQKICCLYLSKKLDPKFVNKLSSAFNLLRYLSPMLSDFNSLEEYLSAKSEELILILDYIGQYSDFTSQYRLWRSLVIYIESNQRIITINEQMTLDFENVHT